ncbi:dihydropteroate synthase [Paenibacillus sambharensis]|uniref:Dihydropteroate synthase n=1 Tax=Paenibacillus sambharensis TaxID=1803190 RepID=A0A2W1LTQ2_9BACL|nr:dihydropteroate synthase [Paenibacillus sambharensis]PZD94837.1 dihydropteroate synthase [Paenibacillus sambharensis]
MTIRPVFYRRSYSWGQASLELGERTLVMGILNTTPDSFSDGGRYTRIDAAVEHAREMAAQGADLIDIGGESTRPGSSLVPLEEELARVIPVIEAVHKALPHIPISIDTYKAETARQALEAGAHIINDVWGLQADPDMARIAAAAGCPVIIGHNRESGGYANLAADIAADLRRSIRSALEAGVQQEQIWVDPGIGFAKDYDDNLSLMGELDELSKLGYPILLGTSRKRFIQRTLDLPPDDVVEGTAATTVMGIMQGCQLVRVHDVQANVRAARMADAVVYRFADIRKQAGE